MARLIEYLQSERATPALLAVVMVGLFVISPLADLGYLHSRLPEYVFWLFLVLGVFIITHHPVLRWTNLVLAVGAVLTSITKGGHHSMLESVFTVLYVVLLTVVYWQRVFSPGRVNFYRIVGAVTIYLFIGVLWAEFYKILELAMPGSFRFGPDFQGARLENNMIYFSFITLTTVGYGDATPCQPLSHSLAVLEALVGQVYLTVLIGRLVAASLQSPALAE